MMRKSKKQYRLQFKANVEQMERRELLSGATVQMTPGSQSQTILPYSDKDLGIIFSTDLSIARDINNQTIDFNKDGFPDLLNLSKQWILNGGAEALVAGFGTNPLLADGGGVFNLTKMKIPNFETGYAPGLSAAVLDWNGDGNQDFLSLTVPISGRSGAEYYIFQNDGRGNFTRAILGQLNLGAGQDYGSSAQILCMADFNSDGAPDLVVPDGLTYTIFNGVVENGKWNGMFDDASKQVLPTGLPFSNANLSPVAADLNGDGKKDIVAPGPDGPRVFMNKGSGQFLASGTFDLASVDQKIAYNVVVADFNGDGKPDIASSNGVFGQTVIGQMSIFLNNTPANTTGNATFETASGAGSASLSYGQLAVGDMNLDGSIDLVVASGSFTNNVYYVLTNNGFGQFPGQRVFEGFMKNQNHVGGIGVADWNMDGQPDVSAGTAWGANPPYPASNSAVAGGIGLSFNTTFQPLGLKTSQIPAARPGVPYSYQLPFTGGNSSLPYYVALNPDGSTMPAGLTLSPTGLISGTPTQSGTFQPLFNITQPDGQRGTALASLNVAASSVSPVLPGIIPNGVAGLPFQQQLTTTLGPANWVVTAGALPAGLSLSQNGLISGTPMGLGTYNFTVLGSGSGFNGVMNYQMLVQAAAAPVVTNLVRYGYHAQPTTLVATFSQPLDAASASNVANYVLTSAGADGRFGTKDDKNIALASASYNAGSNSVTLRLVQKNIPLRHVYALSINGTPISGLQNTGGVYLGGQGVGAPGTNFTQIFSGKILAGPNNLMNSARKIVRKS